MTCDVAGDTGTGTDTTSDTGGQHLSRPDLAFVAAVVAVGVVLRFVSPSPMWLDEALSVNIARLPVGDVFAALRHDGHPPLYYLVLHGWMQVFGEGDVAIRALSGIISVATLPLVWLCARRRAGMAAATAALVIMATAPYNVRYATEARMYSLLSLLGIAIWLLADDLLRRPDRRRWLGVTVLTGLALLTHYWAIYMGAAAVVVLALRWRRTRDTAGVVRVGSALATGSLLFLPWLPSFLEQVRHTGTPWARAARPAQAAQELAFGLGGGDFAEATLFGGALFVLVTLGLSVARASGNEIVLDLRTVPTVRAEVALVALTMGMGVAIGLVTQAAFVARYAAGIVPVLVVAAGVGVARLPGPWPRRCALATTTVLAAVGLFANVRDPRTQGEELARTIVAEGTPDDLVVVCPDQLGPSMLRSLPDSVEAVGVPALERPERIDWVDYAERNEGADPAAVAQTVLDLADGRTVWLVYSGAYRTYEALCPSVLATLRDARPTSAVVVGENPDAFERSALYRFDP